MKDFKKSCLICLCKSESLSSFYPKFLISSFNIEKNEFMNFVFCCSCKKNFVQLNTLRLKLEDLLNEMKSLMLKNKPFSSNAKAIPLRSKIIKALSNDDHIYSLKTDLLENDQETNLGEGEGHGDGDVSELVENHTESTRTSKTSNQAKASKYSLRSSSKGNKASKQASNKKLESTHSTKRRKLNSENSQLKYFDPDETKSEINEDPLTLSPISNTLENSQEPSVLTLIEASQCSETESTEIQIPSSSSCFVISDPFTNSLIEITEESGEVNGKIIKSNSEDQIIEFKLNKKSLLEKKGVFVCEVPNCSFTSSKAHKTRQHYLIDHEQSDKPYVCYFAGCDVTVSSEAKLKYHASTHRPKPKRTKKPGEKSICEICSKEYPSKDQLWRHKKLVHIKKYHALCSVCGKGLSTANTLKKHMSTFHDQTQTFICEICANVFYTDRSLKEHRRFVHCPIEDRTCTICSKQFKNQRALQGHMKQIHGSDQEKIFKCDQCPYTHFMKCQLEKHMLIHEEKTIHCPFPGCKKMFVKEEYLKNHLVQHDDTKRFACPMCDVAFSKRHALEVHKKDHIKADAIQIIGVEEVQLLSTVIVDGIEYTVQNG